VNSWFGAAKSKSYLVQLLDHLHDGDGHAKCHAQANKLTLSGAESNLGLKLGGPVEWASGIHDNEAMPGLCHIGVRCHLVLVLVTSKVHIDIDVKGQASGPNN